jgi:hypothetical protein
MNSAITIFALTAAVLFWARYCLAMPTAFVSTTPPLAPRRAVAHRATAGSDRARTDCQLLSTRYGVFFEVRWNGDGWDVAAAAADGSHKAPRGRYAV